MEARKLLVFRSTDASECFLAKAIFLARRAIFLLPSGAVCISCLSSIFLVALRVAVVPAERSDFLSWTDALLLELFLVFFLELVKITEDLFSRGPLRRYPLNVLVHHGLDELRDLIVFSGR